MGTFVVVQPLAPHGMHLGRSREVGCLALGLFFSRGNRSTARIGIHQQGSVGEAAQRYSTPPPSPITHLPPAVPPHHHSPPPAPAPHCQRQRGTAGRFLTPPPLPPFPVVPPPPPPPPHGGDPGGAAAGLEAAAAGALSGPYRRTASGLWWPRGGWMVRRCPFFYLSVLPRRGAWRPVVPPPAFTLNWLRVS